MARPLRIQYGKKKSDELNHFDATYLSNIGITNLQPLYDYSMKGLDRIQRRFSALDTKASQTISLLAVVSVILVFSLHSPKVKLEELKLILYGSMFCFSISTLCCLLCLRVRYIVEPPSVGKAIEWFKGQDSENLAAKVLTSLIIDIANAERSYIKVYDKKSKYLTIGQDFEVVGIILLILFIGVSQLQLN